MKLHRMVWNQQPLYYEWENCLAKWTKQCGHGTRSQVKMFRSTTDVEDGGSKRFLGLPHEVRRQLDVGRFVGQVQERRPHLAGGGAWKRYYRVVQGWILPQR